MKSSPRFGLSTVSVAIQLFIAFFVIYAITSSGGLEVVDSEARYLTAKSWLEGNGGALPAGAEHFGVPGRGGLSYCFYGPFQSILMAPVVALIAHLARAGTDQLQLFKLVFGIVVIPAISAFSLAILFRALRTFRFGEREAFLAVVTIGLATPMWHYGRSGQEENIIGFAFALYLWGMGQLVLERYGGLILIALAASVIVATRWSYAPALAMILSPVAWLLWQQRAHWRRFGQSLAVGAVCGGFAIAAVLWYNTYRFGRPLENGYGLYFQIHPPFFTLPNAPSHFMALLVSPYRGVIWFCPALLLLLGLKRVSKSSRDALLWKSTLGAWFFTCLLSASISFWNSGPAWAPRYLVALIVLLAPAFAAVFASGQRWRLVLAVSILVQFCSTLLPSSAEDFAYDTMNSQHPGTCTPWVCSCSALCKRGPLALRAIGNTISSRALPVVELTPSANAAGEVSMLQTSDFNSVYWWPVRAAYRAHRLTPALAFAVCMLVLCAAFGALWFFYRRLPASSRSQDAVAVPDS